MKTKEIDVWIGADVDTGGSYWTKKPAGNIKTRKAKLTFEEPTIEITESELRTVMNKWCGFEEDGYIENYIVGELFKEVKDEN